MDKCRSGTTGRKIFYKTQWLWYRAWLLLVFTAGWQQKIIGLGGVFNAVNMDVYHYANQNPIRFVDNKGEDVFGTLFEVSLTGAIGFRYQSGYAIDSDLNVYVFGFLM